MRGYRSAILHHNAENCNCRVRQGREQARLREGGGMILLVQLIRSKWRVNITASLMFNHKAIIRVYKGELQVI